MHLRQGFLGVRRAMAATALLAMTLFAACEGETPLVEPISIPDDQKTRVTIDATFENTSLPRAGRPRIWVNQSTGWDPCPELTSGDVPPATCWIQVVVDTSQVAVLYPEPEGTLGPFPIDIHFDIFDLGLGEHSLQLVQNGRLEIRETAPVPFTLIPPPPTPTPEPTATDTPTATTPAESATGTPTAAATTTTPAAATPAASPAGTATATS